MGVLLEIEQGRNDGNSLSGRLSKEETPANTQGVLGGDLGREETTGTASPPER